MTRTTHANALRKVAAVAATAAVSAAAITATSAAAQEINVYSGRQEVLIRPQLEAFTAATGIEVNLIAGRSDELIKRLRTEGANSPADVLLTVDVSRLTLAKNLELLQSVDSEALRASIPPQYRDAEGAWYGLGLRSRVLYYAPDRVDPSELSTYEQLADPMWRNRICIRSSTNVYNQSLLASLIAHNGAEAAETWAAGIVANMARTPQGATATRSRLLPPASATSPSPTPTTSRG